MEYTLSVVIPNYNNSKFITKCIESIVSQSYEKLVEIIVVDDCSTDNSREIINELALKYSLIKPIFLEKNGKVSNARNTGLNAAIGEYITFVDADDYYYNPNKLKNEMALLIKNNDIYCDAVAYSSIVKVTNDGEKYTFPRFKNSEQHTGNVYEKLLMDIHSGKVIRDYCIKTQILREIGGYNTERSLFEDYELMLKIAKRCYVLFTGEYGTAYRDSLGGLSKVKFDLAVKTKNEVAMEQIKKEANPKRTVLAFKRKSIQLLKKVYHLVKRSKLK